MGTDYRSAELTTVLTEVLAAHPQAEEQIRSGDRKPWGFLVGQIMQATSGRAEPSLVQKILQDHFTVSTIDVLSFGGAIAGHRQADGLVVPGDLKNVRDLLRQDPQLPEGLRFEEIQLGRFLSEEITPADWGALIGRVAERLETGESRGIVIGHGTDTLTYTASLLFYWFFADTRIPIVLTASTVPSEEGSRGDGVENLRRSVATATGIDRGIHVVYGEDDFFPLNLKFERAGGDAQGVAALSNGVARDVEGSGPTGNAYSYRGRFRNWNADQLKRIGQSLAGTARSLPTDELIAHLETAIGCTFIAKVYPGMRGETLIALMDAGIRYFVLEIYDTGTANLRETPFSLKTALTEGRERGVHFFCTSQQEGVVDFSEYVTAHQLWREGAIPMGALTTESVWTRLIAAQVEALSGEYEGQTADETVLQLMEDGR